MTGPPPPTLSQATGLLRLEAAIERHRSASKDLEALLRHPGTSTILVDANLHVQHFSEGANTPFHLVPTDVGRPIADLRLIAGDHTIHRDCHHVLRTGDRIVDDIVTADNQRYQCLIEPVRNDGIIAGVLIEFVMALPSDDVASNGHVTEGREGHDSKSRSIAALSHDLRQPMQTLTLLLYRIECLDPTPPTLALLRQCEQALAAIAATLDGMLAPAPLPKDMATPRIGVPVADCIGTILLVEDDLEIRELLADTLGSLGFHVMAAADAAAALDLVDRCALEPDVLLTDFRLPDAVDGHALGLALRDRLGCDIPLLILTGETPAPDVSRTSACTWLMKPVHLDVLAQRLLEAMTAGASTTVAPPLPPTVTTICLVDDDASVRDLISEVLVAEGFAVQAFADCNAFLAADLDPAATCLILDLGMPGMDGHHLLAKLHAADTLPPTIVLTANGNPRDAVRAMQAGALDFLVKPVSRSALLAAIASVMAPFMAGENPLALRRRARQVLAGLTARQRDVMAHILAGQPNKIIAADLAVSQRTVENHRAAIMRRTGARSLPDLARLSIAAGE